MKPRRILRAAAALVAAYLAGTLALPGPVQALAPRWNGLAEIAPGVFTDAPGNAETALADLAAAEARVAAVFGAAPDRPRLILCYTYACARRFLRGAVGPAEGPAAIAYGAHLAVVTPRGLNPTILAHEISHIALHGRMTLTDLADQRYPGWFDEGLASWISRDDRLIPPDAAARARILEVHGFRDWNGAIDDLGWRRAYGAALALVDEMVAAGGVDGLHALIDRVARGADFDAERAALLGDGRQGGAPGE